MSGKTAKTLVHIYFDRLLNQHDLSVCDQLLAPEYVDHDAIAGTPPGPSSTKAFATTLIHDYPDIRVHIVDLLAEANLVAARLIWQGTHRLSDAPLHQHGIVMLRLNGQGKIAERWSAYTRFTDDQQAMAKNTLDQR